MKITMKKLLLLPVLFGILFFTSCQDGYIDITEPTSENEIIAAKSEVATLVKQTTTNDGSEDNIIDRANCFRLVLPVTIFANLQEITVNTKEDFKAVETVFDESDDDEDTVEMSFPVTIILKDHSEVVVNSRAEMIEYRNSCKGEDEDDDDIECVDFKYPISYSVFNSDKSLLNTIKIQNDREMYRFIHNLTENDIVSINFPVMLVFFDGTETQVNNLKELRETLRAARDFCNEDDNNDFGDDDFTKEQLDKLLVMCPWIVHHVRRNATDLAEKYREYAMNFKEDGTVKVRARNGDMITGTWITRVTHRGAMIKLDFDSFVDFTLEWFVHEMNRGKIKLFTSVGNRIILEKNCDIVFDHTIDRIKSILEECHWRVARLRIDGMVREGKYIGTPLKFEDDGTVKLRINGEFVSGTWDILKADAGFVLKMNLDNRPDLNLHWLITLIGNRNIKLENQNSEMLLKKYCPDDEPNIKTILNNGKWQVASYIEGDVNETEIFDGFIIDFLENGGIYIEGNDQIIDGSWLPYRHENMLFLGLNFGLEPPFDELNARWRVVELDENKIELQKLSLTNTTTRKLIFEKI